MAKGLSGYDAAVEDLVFKAILPEQLTVGRQGGFCKTGTWRLMYAVLMDAAVSLIQNKGVRNDDLDWVCSGDRHHLFTFENVCQALSLDPDATRDRLIKRWIEAPSKEGEPPCKKTSSRPLIRRYHVGYGRRGT
jgi:hypothetical protein